MGEIQKQLHDIRQNMTATEKGLRVESTMKKTALQERLTKLRGSYNSKAKELLVVLSSNIQGDIARLKTTHEDLLKPVKQFVKDPFWRTTTASYLKKGLWNSFQVKWYRQYYKWIKIIVDTDFHINQYKFFDSNDDEH